MTIKKNPRKTKSVLEMTPTEAADFFLKGESYCAVDLPNYFSFESLLQNVKEKMNGKTFNELNAGKPIDHDDVNYTLLGNKDGKFSWRPFELINPVLYTSLVNLITTNSNWRFLLQQFKSYKKDHKIQCKSIPIESQGDRRDKAEQITNWWGDIEQASIAMALDFECVFHADIANCYGSIYTHSIPWALHTKQHAKENRQSNGLLGNSIDTHLRSMSYGQTNGIPQGSVLMDFVAEILLGAVDKDLSTRLKKDGISKFRILRYRDDYRIFVHNQTDGMLILKTLSEVLAAYGLKLNSSKTIRSNSVIRDSIKQDKLFYLIHLSSNQSITKHLLLIHNLAERYPDSGSLLKSLGVFYKKIESKSLKNQKLDVLVSIIVDIMYGNPKSIPHCTAILSLLLSSYSKIYDKKRVIKKIKVKFNSIPNTGLLQLWLQRITLPIDRKLKYSEPLCNIVINEDIEIWNNTWIINSKLKSALKKSEIVIEDKVNSLNPKVSYDEVSLFDY